MTSTAKRSRRKRITLFRAVVALVLAVFVGGFVVGWRFRVREVDIPLGLSEPVRVAVMSDIHLGSRGSAGMTERAVAEAMRRRPDLVVLVGDFVAGKWGLASIPSALKGLHAPLGVYAVLGNHDHWADGEEVRAQLAAAGVRVLVNDNVILRKGGTRLPLVGIDDLWTGHVDWERAWRGVPRGLPAILLSHNPQAAAYPAGQRASLILSGHTHGGKIRLPRWMLPLLRRYAHFTPIPHTTYGERHPYGLVREKWGWVYITSGVATGYSPPRWYTRPELAVLELR